MCTFLIRERYWRASLARFYLLATLEITTVWSAFKGLFVVLSSLFSTALSFTFASASTLDLRDLETSGGGFISLDAATRLRWLDPSRTVHFSFTQVVARLGVGGAFQGLRFANLEEEIELWENAEIDTSGLISPEPTVANDQSIARFAAKCECGDAEGSLTSSTYTDFILPNPHTSRLSGGNRR